MDPLRIPKRRTEIEVTFADGSVRKVAVFLAEQASRHGGEERVRDLLESSAYFVPGIDREGDGVAFLAKDSIAVVRTDEPPWERDEVNLPLEHEVDVRLGVSPEDLLQAVRGADALIIRSATKVTEPVLDAAGDLIVVGRAGIGVDNVDVAAATREQDQRSVFIVHGCHRSSFHGAKARRVVHFTACRF